jgi:hypothetical protein
MAIRFTEDELDQLEQMLECWSEGMGPARDQTIDDPTIESAEQLLDLAAGIDHMDVTAVSIARKVRGERNKPRWLRAV